MTVPAAVPVTVPATVPVAVPATVPVAVAVSIGDGLDLRGSRISCRHVGHITERFNSQLSIHDL